MSPVVERAQPCVECRQATFSLWRLLPLCHLCFIEHILTTRSPA